VQNDVLWLNIPMDDIMPMDDVDSQAHLSNNIGCHSFGKPPLLFNHVKQLSTATDLEEEVDGFGVVEETVKVNDVLVM
jgi:hypothetical protein